MTKFLSESPAFNNVIQQLQGSSVLVIGHRRPDGDCIGSQVAMTRILRNLGIDATAVNNDPVPRTLQKFIGDTPFVGPSEIKEQDYRVVTVDCADHSRVGDDLRNRYPQVFLNVDHHVSNTKFAEHNFVLSDASATGEILAKFFFDSVYDVDKTSAEGLYLGICTDTGQFCYSGTNAAVFEICRKLCEAGCNPSNVAHELYEREKPGRIQLLQKFLASFKMEFDDRVCIGNIRGQNYEETGTKPEDAENFVDYARSLEGVEIGVLLEDRKGALKGSFRAKDKKYRVDLLAKKFEGGGHACAAGFNVNVPFEEFYPNLVEKIGEHLAVVKTGGF